MEKNVLANNNSLKKYFWERIGSNTYELHLGTMKRAIILRKNIELKWYISEGSFFPFPNEFYNRRFDYMTKAKQFSQEYICQWLNETIKQIQDEI